MPHSFSAHARTGTERWEEFVAYPYDDKVAPRVINGRRQYVEWTGGKVKGTITIGFGHTDAAGLPKIVPGMRITLAEADEILSNDLSPVVHRVNRDVKVQLTQGQFDALADFCFNCGGGALDHLIVKLNQGDYDDIPGHMMQYVMCKGERLQGLVNRRKFEIGLWNSKEPSEVAHPVLDENNIDNFSPKAERIPPPKSMAASQTGHAAMTIGAGGVYAAMASVNQAAGPVEEAKQHLVDLGLMDQLIAAAHTPMFWIAVGIIGLAGFVWWDRHQKLWNDHV